ncbi:LytR/AlgR family response regulator transcription factor [Sphingobacterium prati]|uniref:LytR/AlgR family response regulator transcription factor n=1 Tax=Sphingobacterium prati TaxID=2737006 RepID=UPI0015561EE6|nr:LytTR family DNA-binding domain-containing protein [Sphingobacterium prati]NPE44977.1 response regulator transcription factor [Sphingobacterium prati]
MYKINVIIIEDEFLALKRLESMVERVEWLMLSGSYGNLTSAKEVLESGNVNLMISNIQAPGSEILAFLRSLSSPPFVIFVTNHREFAVDGYELDVVDYILKPSLTLERFEKAISKVRNLIISKQEKQLNQILKFKDGHKSIFINSDHIFYIKAMGDYAQIITKDENHTVSTTLKDLEKRLNENRFIRIHKSHIVNVNQIKSVEAIQVSLKNNLKLDIGLKYRANLYSIMGL